MFCLTFKATQNADGDADGDSGDGDADGDSDATVHPREPRAVCAFSLCVAARQIHLESQPGKHLCSNAACLQLSVSQRQRAHTHTHVHGGRGEHTLMSGSSAQSAIS